MAGRLSTETRLSDMGLDRLATTAATVPTLTLLTHPVVSRIGERVALPELASGETVELSRLGPLFAHSGGADAHPLADPHLSRTPLLLVPVGSVGEEGGEIRVERAGSPTPVRVDGLPLADHQTLDRSAIDRGVTFELGRQVALLLDRQPPLLPKTPSFGLVGESAAMVKLRQEIDLAARLDTSVLLRGASGTGKELVARALHDAGARCEGPWVTVNMAAIPTALAAAELFGARRGAYTGADRDKEGFFAAADGGTLFLDEVGDTPLEVQPLLLRALESGEIQPVGSAKSHKVDVRVIAATDTDLDQAIAEGRFRAPLLHRLAGWAIRLPTLAERRSDIGRLLVHFVARELGVEPYQLGEQGPPPWASASLVGRLARHTWPGNVRELANVARRLAILGQANPESPLETFLDDLLRPGSAVGSDPGWVAAGVVPAGGSGEGPGTPTGSPRAAEPPPGASPTGKWRPVYRKAAEVVDDELLAVLRAHRFDLKPTAEALGVSRSVLYQLVERCPGLRTAAQLERGEIERVLGHNDHDVEAAAAELEVSAQGLKLRMKAFGLR